MTQLNIYPGPGREAETIAAYAALGIDEAPQEPEEQ
jgi:hypothetical protein